MSSGGPSREFKLTGPGRLVPDLRQSGVQYGN